MKTLAAFLNEWEVLGAAPQGELPLNIGTAHKPAAVNHEFIKKAHEEPNITEFVRRNRNFPFHVIKKIRQYKNSSYNFNRRLRESQGEHFRYKSHKDLDDVLQEHVFQHQLEKPLTVYRGMHPRFARVNSMKPGTLFKDHAYTSTSTSHQTANFFARRNAQNKRTIFVLHLPEGTRAHHFDAGLNTGYSDEREVVVDRGTTYRVTHHTHNTATNTHYIHATVHAQRPRPEKEEKPNHPIKLFQGTIFQKKGLSEWIVSEPHQKEMFPQHASFTKPLPHRASTPPEKVPNHDSFKQHMKKLPLAAKKTILHYKVRSEDINGFLREKSGKILDGPHMLLQHDQEMSQAVAHELKEPMTVYRGVDPSLFKLHKMKVGALIKDHAYISTSAEPAVAHNFASTITRKKKNHKTIVFALHLPEGTRAHHFDIDTDPTNGFHEHEVVVDRGTTFRVTHHTVNQGGGFETHYIHATVHEQRSDNPFVKKKGLSEWIVLGSHPQGELPLQHANEYRDETKLPNNDLREFAAHHRKLSAQVKTSVRRYKNGSKTFNRALRSGKTLTFHHNEMDKHMAIALNHPLEKPLTVYRGVHHKFSRLHQMEPGTLFKDHAYISASEHHHIARSFATPAKNYGGTQTIFVLHLPAGTRAHHIDSVSKNKYDHEREVVVDRGTTFRVTHRTQDKMSPNIHYIHAVVHAQRSPPIPSDHHSDLPLFKSLKEWIVLGQPDQKELPLTGIHKPLPHKRSKIVDKNTESFRAHHEKLPAEVKETMKNYKVSSNGLNMRLREGSGKVPHDSYGADFYNEADEHLSHATSHTLPESMTVYRGMHYAFAKLRDMKPGTLFKDHAYTSTSTDPGVAKYFAITYKRQSRSIPKDKSARPDRKYVFALHLPEGTKAHHFDLHDDGSSLAKESEVVLHKGTTFRVTHHTVEPAQSQWHEETHYIHATVHHQE